MDAVVTLKMVLGILCTVYNTVLLGVGKESVFVTVKVVFAE